MAFGYFFYFFTLPLYFLSFPFSFSKLFSLYFATFPVSCFLTFSFHLYLTRNHFLQLPLSLFLSFLTYFPSLCLSLTLHLYLVLCIYMFILVQIGYYTPIYYQCIISDCIWICVTLYCFPDWKYILYIHSSQFTCRTAERFFCLYYWFVW